MVYVLLRADPLGYCTQNMYPTSRTAAAYSFILMCFFPCNWQKRSKKSGANGKMVNLYCIRPKVPKMAQTEYKNFQLYVLRDTR